MQLQIRQPLFWCNLCVRCRELFNCRIGVGAIIFQVEPLASWNVQPLEEEFHKYESQVRMLRVRKRSKKVVKVWSKRPARLIGCSELRPWCFERRNMHQNICCLFQTRVNDFSSQRKCTTPKHTHGHIFNLLHVPWCGKLWFSQRDLKKKYFL